MSSHRYFLVILSCMVSLFSQGRMNSYGLGHFYNNQGNISSQHTLVTLSPSFKNNVALLNPSTWHNLNYSILSLSYSGNQNTENNQSFINGYSDLSNALLIIPYKSNGSFGIEISPYINQMVSLKDSSDTDYYAFDDTLNYNRSIDRSGGIMNFKIGSSIKIKKLLSFGLSVNYLFGSSRANNAINFGGSSIISTTRLKHNATFLDMFFHKNFINKLDLFFMFKQTLKPLSIETHLKPLFDDVNSNSFYDDFDFPYFGDYKSDTVQVNKIYKPSGYGLGVNYFFTKNSSFSIEYMSDQNNFNLDNGLLFQSLVPIDDWINDSEKLSMSVIKFPGINNSSIIGGLTTRIGFTYLKHSMQFDESLIKEYGASIGLGFKFKPVENQIDVNYYIGSRNHTRLGVQEIAQQIQVGLSIADLWFVRRRQK
jgi:hypothetical protein